MTPGAVRVTNALIGTAQTALMAWAATETGGVLAVLLYIFTVLSALGTLVRIAE